MQGAGSGDSGRRLDEKAEPGESVLGFLDRIFIHRQCGAATDLKGFLQNVVDFCTPEVQDKGISLRFYPGQEIGKLDFDVNLLRAALVNLLRNAREACSEGDEIMVSTQRQDDGVVVQVTDTGPGMDEEQLQEAFKPYFSTKKNGTGLGLSITLRIVEEHGGTIELSAEKGKGTQFTIRLPASPKEAEAG